MDNRNLSYDLLALVLFVVVVFLGLSVFTYTPADPVADIDVPWGDLYQPDVLVYPTNAQVTNVCGPWGAVAADLLVTSLGLGAFYLVVSLAVLDVALLRRTEIDVPLLRLIGWILSLVGVVTMASILAPPLAPSPMVGAGGYAGRLVRGLLELRFATMGGLILSLSMLVGGLLLSTDYAVFRLGYWMMKMFGLGSVASYRLVRGKSTATGDQAVEDEVDEEEEWEEEYEDGEYDELEEYEEEEYEDEEEEEAEEAPEIRIRNKKKRKAEEVTEETSEAEAEEEATAENPEPAVEEPIVIKRKRPKPAAAKAPTKKEKEKEQEKSERDLVIDQLEEASRKEEDASDYELPSPTMLIEPDDICFEDQAKEVRRKAKILEKTFGNFGFKVRVVEIETGPVIAQYEVELEAGLRLSKITGLADDLAIALRVPSVRIVAPIPGKNTVGIEVPNSTRQVVRLREVIEESEAEMRKMRIPLFLGKDVSGNPLTVDLSKLPHLLIAGRTGTGKSVCLNAIISSILMTKRPDEVRMLMIDPKMVELSGYGRLPHLMHPVVTDMKKAEAILAWAVDKMEERYALLARAGVRHISSYNQLGEDELTSRLAPENEEERDAIPTHLPFIVIVADEMADLMMTAGKEVEQHIIRLAQKSRAVGIHLILATQKPTVDVITGLIKSNLPARISFQVASRTDSRVVLDEMGADKLLGNGDMLFLYPGTSSLLRGQGTFLSDDEIEQVTDFVSTGEQHFVNELVNMKVDEGEEGGPDAIKKRDDLYESAIDVVIREGRGSVSLLQRSLGIGYGRAARLIDYMAEDGIVGAYAGSQAREVLITVADWERMQGNEGGDVDDEGEPAAAAPPPKKKKKPIPLKPKPASKAQVDIIDVDADEDWEDDEEEEEEVVAEIDEEDDEEVEYYYEDDDEVEAEYDEDEYEDEEYDDEEEYEDDEAVAEDDEYEYEDDEEEYEAESA